MDYCNWKQVIYEWIKSSNFISIEIDKIEHTELDKFYEEFRQKLTSTVLKETTVTEFLRAHYDSFDFHLDDSKEISSLDYVYIYSLLLHFSCVKYPDQYFHKLCQSLEGTSQMYIANLFNLLMVNDKFDRDKIRAAITAAKPNSFQVLPLDSPIKTPNMISPTTPRTTLLEEKRREVIMLKAQIDSERYDRSMLEVMLKQTEKKLEKMVQNQRKYIEENQSLKNELLSLDTENRSPNKNFIVDQKNHRLQKDLLEKEERIIQYQLTIDNLMDDKQAAAEKLALNEKQTSLLIDKTRDLEQIILDVRAQLDDRSEKIKSLQETNADLLNFIRESRGGAIHGLESLNTSSCEGLDISFAHISNSSNISSSSPENLGGSVIDVQLKEKQKENDMLRDKMELLKHDFNRITTEIWNFCNSNSDMKPLDPNESHDEYSLPLKQFEKCKTYFVDKLATSEEFVKNLSAENNKLKERINELGDEQDELSAALSKVKQEISCKERTFNAKICEFDELLLTKTSENTDLFSQIERQQTDIESLSTQLDAINKANSRLENELAVSSATISELKELCESRYAEIETIGCQNDLVRAENKDLLSTVKQLESTVDEINRANATENSRLTSEIVELSRIVANVTDENTAAEEKIQQLTHKIFQSGEETRELRDRIEQISQREDRLIDDHQKLLEKMSDVLAEKVLLAQEVADYAKSNSEILERFEKSINDRATLKSQFEAHIEELAKALAQAENEKIKLKLECEQISASNLEIVNHLKEEINELTGKIEALNKNSLELTESIAKNLADKSALIEKLAKLEDVNAQSEIRIDQILSEKSELAKQISMSKFNLSEMGTEVANLKLQLELLGQTNESTAKSNSDLIETISSIQAEKNNLIAQIEQINEEKASSLSRIQDLSKIINETSTKNVELTSEKIELIEKVAKFETQIEILNQTNETAANMNSEYVETISKCQKDFRNLRAQYEQTILEKENSAIRIQELGQIVDEISSKNSGLTSEKTEVTEKLTKFQADFDNSKIRIAQLELEIQTLNQANESVSKSNSENVASITKLEEECCNLRAQLEHANLEIVSFVTRTEELCQLDEENSQKLSKMNKEITRLNLINETATKEKTELAKKLEIEIENVRQINVSTTKSNSDYTQTISQLQEQIGTLTRQYDKAQEEIDRLSARICELSRTVEENAFEMSNLKNANETVTKEKSELTDKLTKFETDCARSKSRVAELQLDVESLTQTKDTMANTISEYVENVSKLQEEIRILSVDILQANTKIADYTARIQELDQIIDETSTKNAGLMKEKVELTEQLVKLQADCINSETRISEMVTEIQTLRQIKESVDTSNAEYVEVISALRKENLNLGNQLKKSTNETKCALTQIEELKDVIEKASVETSVLNTTNNLIKKEKTELTEQISVFQSDCTNLKLQLQTLNQLNESAAKSNSEYLETISKLQVEIQNLSVQLVQANTKIDSSVGRVQELREIVDESSTKILKLTSEKAELIEQLSKYQTDCTNSATRIFELVTEIETLNQIKESVNKSNSEYVEVISKLEEENRILNNQLQKATTETESSLAQVKELEQRIEKASDEILVLKTSNDLVTIERADLSEQVSKLQSDCANLELELQTLNQLNDSAAKSNSEYLETISKHQVEIQNLNVQLVQANAEIGSSVARVQELSKNVDESSTKILGLNSEKAELIEQLSKYQTDCVNSATRISELVTEIETLNQIKESVNKSNLEYVEVISKLEEENHNLSNQLQKATTEIESSLAQVKELEQRIEQASDEILVLKTSNDLVTKERAELSEQVSKFQSGCTNLELELQTLKQLNESATKSNSAYLETILKLQAESENLDVQLDQANAEISSSAVRIQELSKLVHESSTKIVELDSEKTELIKELNKLEADCVKFETRIIELTSENEALIQANAKFSSEYTQTISNLQDESNNLRNELARSTARIQEINEIAVNEKTELAEQLAKLQTDLIISETRTAELTTEISEITTKRDEILTKLEIQISEFLTQRNALSEELRNSMLEVQILNQSNNSVAKSNSEFAETISKLEESSEILTSELKTTKETNCRLVEQIDKSKAQIQELTDSRVNEIAKFESLISELHKEKYELVQIVGNLKEESSRLTGRLENSEIQIQEKSKTNSELLDKIEHLAKEKSEIQAKSTQEADKFTAEISKILAENAKLSEEVTSLQTEIKRLIQSNKSQTDELSTKNSELSTEIIELRTNSEKLRETNLRLTEEIFTSESKIKELLAENKTLGDNIMALNSENRVEKDRMLKKVEQLTGEIDNIVQNYEALQKEKTNLDIDLKITKSELFNLKESHSDAHSIKLILIDKEQTINSLEYNLNKLQNDKLEKDKHIENLVHRVSQKEMELNRERTLNEKCTQDIAILKAKLYKNRETSEEREQQWNAEKEQLMEAIEEQKSAEERITENRLELVGKLEKMKSKMKTLYNEEMVKVKTKHENEISDFQKQANEKFGKYDAHIEKLSKQIYQLNERNLGLEKDNKFLRTKIDFLEINTDAAGSTMALNSMGSGGSRNLLQSTNLKMEDEEGEIFNNTYLTDLKTDGRISPTSGLGGRDSVKYSELQHRNSLMPRHLRSTYAAQYGDQDLREDDLKDPINFDDSLNSLLYGGQRKKVSGATTYKRPGPPTPSKNAGRLSIGAITELQSREILKENNSNIPTRLSMTSTGFGMGNCGNKRNTPGKLKSLFSNSTSKIKDDFHSDKSMIVKKKQIQQLMITSTPRRQQQNLKRGRSRLSGHLGITKTAQKYNARRIKVAAYMQSGGSLSTPQVSPVQKVYGDWRQAGSIIDSESCTSTSQTASEFEGEPCNEHNSTLKSSMHTSRRRSTKFTVKTNTLSHTRNRYRMKSKENRLENFNRARQSINNFILRKSLLSRSGALMNDDGNCLDLEPDPYVLLKDLVDLSSQAVAAAKFNDGEAPSFAEFEKLTKFKASEAPFEVLTTPPDTNNVTIVAKSSSQKKKALYSGGVIVNRKIPRLSIRIGGYHILNRGFSNDSSSRSFDRSSCIARNWSRACVLWRQYEHRMKIFFGIGAAVILLILNLICVVKFLYF